MKILELFRTREPEKGSAEAQKIVREVQREEK